jgi:hypothetical protein
LGWCQWQPRGASQAKQENIFIFFGTPGFFSCMIPVVFEPGIIQGRFIGEAELAQVRSLLSAHGDWSRWRVSRHLAQLWEWRSASGQLKDMAARTLLLKLEERGLIMLPKRRQASPVRKSRKPASEPALGEDLFPEQARAEIRVPLPELLPLGIEEISRVRKVGKQAEFSHLLGRHHYLGHRGTVGENMQYLVSDARGTLLACVLFGAAAWQRKARDSETARLAGTRRRGREGSLM